MKDIEISDIKVLWNSDEIDSAVKKLSKKIIKQFKEYDSINLIPILTGGLVFASKLLIELASLTPGSSRMFPLIAKTYGNSIESQGTKIYGYEFLSDSLERNSPSIIVDDLMDTGETLLKVRENVLGISNDKVYTAVLVDKLGNRNNIFNVPLNAGTKTHEFLNAYDSIFKKLKTFKPEFILLSAGFDAHKDDPLAQINLESKDYYTLTNRILTLAKKLCGGKVVSILEGGYDLNALKESVDYHVKSLMEQK